MNDCCFVCPIYLKDRDYNFALDMYESKIKNSISVPIYFVFSYETHMAKFKELFNERFGFEYSDGILVPENFLQYKCQVTTKKLYAVKQLQNQYKYIAVIDCECLFIKSADICQVFTDIWKKKSFMVANKSYLLQPLLKVCVEGLDLKNKKQIKKDTENYVYNCWFNDIPVYNTDYTQGFFAWLEEQNTYNILNNYLMVDYYIYLLYLIDTHEFKITKLNEWAPLGIMEELSHTHVDRADDIEKQIGTHWTSNRDSKNERAIMLFHRDHTPNQIETKDFINFAKIRYLFGRLTFNNRKAASIFNHISKYLWKTKYFHKYRW